MSIERRYNAGVSQDPDQDHFLDEEGNFDIVRFILQTTHEVWDQQRFERIRDYFAEDFISYGAEGREFGDLDELFDYALPRTSAFPDTRVFVDDLLWTGNEQTGFKTSHSFTVTGTNTGESKYGPPTGKRLRLTGIANCKVEKVNDEWKYTEERAEDDQFAIIRACTPGQVETYPDIPDVELDDSNKEPSSNPDEEQPSATEPVDSVETQSGEFDPGAYLEEITHELWNDRSVGILEDHYSEDVVVEAASGRRLRDVTELRSEVLERLAAFPNLELTIDDTIVVAEESGYNSSIAYTVTGTHAGPSKYGSATGKSVTFTGIINQKLRKVSGEWRVVKIREDFDELRLMKSLK